MNDDASDGRPPAAPPAESSRRRLPSAVGRALADAWAEHRPHVALATGLFALGVVLGAILGATGFDLLSFIVETTGQDPFGGIEEADLTPWFFVANNSVPFVAAIAGAITLGLFTAYIMVFNGILVGNLSWFVGSEVGVGFVFVGLAPHGIFELPALFVAAGVGFRLLHRAVQRLRGRRDVLFTKSYLGRTALLVLVAWLALVLAAVIEATVTGVLLDALFADRIDTQTAAANETAASVTALVTGR